MTRRCHGAASQAQKHEFNGAQDVPGQVYCEVFACLLKAVPLIVEASAASSGCAGDIA